MTPIYKHYKSRYKNLLQESKKQYYSNIIESSDNKSSTMWKIVNKLSNKQPKSQSEEIKLNDQIVSDPTDIANAFNNFFQQAPQNIVQTIPNNDYRFPEHLFNTKSMLLYELDESEILQLFNQLKNKTSIGVCGLSNRILKEFKHLLVHPINI